jgi:hypothetical protein
MKTRSGRLSGYALVSTDAQGTNPQRDEAAATRCAAILEEYASGSDLYRARSWVGCRAQSGPARPSS